MSISENCKQIQDVNSFSMSGEYMQQSQTVWHFGINMLDSISTSKSDVVAPTFMENTRSNETI